MGRFYVIAAVRELPSQLLGASAKWRLYHATSEPIHDLIFKLNETHGTTMVLVTHNPDLAAQLPRTLTMLDGVIVDSEDAGAD